MVNRFLLPEGSIMICFYNVNRVRSLLGHTV